MASLPLRTRWPRTVTLPSLSGCTPSTALRSVDLPEPLGPSTATSSPAPTERSTPCQTVRPPSRTAAFSTRTATAPGDDDRGRGRACGGASATEGAQQVPQLAGLPLLEGGAGRRRRLGDLDDRDPPRLRLVDQVVDVRRGVLAVE